MFGKTSVSELFIIRTMQPVVVTFVWIAIILPYFSSVVPEFKVSITLGMEGNGVGNVKLYSVILFAEHFNVGIRPICTLVLVTNDPHSPQTPLVFLQMHGGVNCPPSGMHNIVA